MKTQQKKHKKVIKKTPRTHKPEGMSLEEWQVTLRREFGREQNFRYKNIGAEPVFSEFEVTNPQTNQTYRVAIRGANPGENFCSCPDFAVNTLGTCKHVEFILNKLSSKRGVKKVLSGGYAAEYSEIFLRYGSRREVMFRTGSQCPAALQALADKYFDDNGILTQAGYAGFDVFLKKASSVKKGHELRCYDDALNFIAKVRDQAALTERIGKAFPKGKESAAFEQLLKVPLYPYQREGALFAARAGRSLLADDMGLGKTIQAIAAAEILARTMGVERVLIVSPTSLKYQWKSEIEKFTDRTVGVVEGSLLKRRAAYGEETFFKITNYDVIHHDLDRIAEWQPDLIILDEAQRIKNWKTRTAKSVKKLESSYAIVLTGTPLENRLEELHSLVEFVDRYRLGPTFRFLAEHQHVDENGRVIGYKNLATINETLQPILLRRTKESVLKELPERMVKNLFVPMTKEQMAYHDENREIVSRIVSKWRHYKFLSEADQRRLMIAMQNMRMSCNSTYLLDQKTDFGVKANEFMTQLSEMCEDPSAKVVVFSQWVRTHELLANRLGSEERFVFFHGGVAGTKRGELIKRFKEDDACRVFLSTDAGGVGLNLQTASAVVNMDQPWNPAVLEQRIGRVHRLGQRKPVRVINFIAQGTIEERMLSLLSFKKSVFTGVLDGGQDEVFLGGSRLNQFMKTVEQASSSIPSAMPVESPEIEERTEKQTTPSPQSDETWNEILTAGVGILKKLGESFLGETKTKVLEDKVKERIDPSRLMGRDETTGETYLKIPTPKPETMKKVFDLLTELFEK